MSSDEPCEDNPILDQCPSSTMPVLRSVNLDRSAHLLRCWGILAVRFVLMLCARPRERDRFRRDLISLAILVCSWTAPAWSKSIERDNASERIRIVDSV